MHFILRLWRQLRAGAPAPRKTAPSILMYSMYTAVLGNCSLYRLKRLLSVQEQKPALSRENSGKIRVFFA
ncbi:MAG: hypothetical protein ACI9LO_002712 [Planctomycetota bacterium]|jgi:hypothetical protein